MMMWLLGYAYIALLCALSFMAMRGEEPMRRTVWTLFGVMVFAYAYSFIFGGGWVYSLYMVVVNALACWVITMHPASRWQALVGWSFVIQIGSDIGRVAIEINGGVANLNLLYWETTGLAYLQLLLLIGWGLDGLRRRNSWGRSDSLPAPANRSGVA